jgi:AcrR family transcriptional regulator
MVSKGEETRISILQQALDLSSEVGLEGLTIGALAKRVGMSKSGLYAHFESKEDLQTQVLHTAASLFVDVVVTRALKEPRGLPRVKALFERWLDWTTENLSGGCPFIAAATEYDDRSGPVRDSVVGHLSDAIETIARAARISVDEGHFRADLDADQFAFEVWGVLLSYHYFARLHRCEEARTWACQAFSRIIENAGGARQE